MRNLLCAVALCSLGVASAATSAPQLWWYWDRPAADLPALPTGVAAALVVSHVLLAGDGATRIPRRSSLPLPSGAWVLPVIHVEVDPGHPFGATPAQRSIVSDAVLDTVAFGRSDWVQLDFEARLSQRAFWLDVVRSVRARLPAGVRLSVTALASWCHGDRWLHQAPVDEIVPMYFRLGPRRAEFERRTAAGAIDPRCAGAHGVADDEPPWPVALPGRRYVFLGRPSARRWNPGAQAPAGKP